MTRDEAITIVEMILNSWPGPEWHEERLQAYVSALIPLDAELTTKAVAKAVTKLKFRPSIAELREFIQLQRRMSDEMVQAYTPIETENRPDWVLRWYAARAVGDLRPFPEQRLVMEEFASMSPEHYAVHAPPLMPTTDREFWVQDDEYLEALTL